jgi:septum formation protein
MLTRLGLAYELALSDVDESVAQGEPACAAVRRLALTKAWTAEKAWPGRTILAADTLVTMGDLVLGKPADLTEARAMLERLSGREHAVVSGWCIIHAGRERQGLAETAVRFRALVGAEIAAYLASGEPLGKAGAYAVQGLGAAMVAEMKGSYTNVVGLPLGEVVEALLGLGVIETVRVG